MVSNLKNHKYNKKKALIQPPMNRLPNQTPVSWTDDRLPEYLWLGLILMAYDRTEGIEKVGKILKGISNVNESILEPKLSTILLLDESQQEEIYEIIISEIDSKILAPLTLIYRNINYSVFNKYFNFHETLLQHKLTKIDSAIKLYYNHQANESTDLRFCVLFMLIFQDKLRMPKEMVISLSEYPYTSHEDEKMRQYRPLVRASEMTMGMTDIANSRNQEFIDNFWKEIGLKIDCNPIVIGFNKEEDAVDYKAYILDFQKKLNHLINEQKDKSLMDDKFDVILGTTTYSLKIFNDVVEKELDESILGRHAYRTILEAYINIKYLLKIETEHTNIWEEYKLYGIGKYKLPLLKERESSRTKDKTHFVEPVIDSIINEILWEEFVDIDLRYFDKKKIKEKFEEVGEKDLYEILYEYDNNFIHGFWGAVRESSMLHCNNPSHRYHSIPDISFEQKMISINHDIYKIINKFFLLVSDEYQHEYK